MWFGMTALLGWLGPGLLGIEGLVGIEGLLGWVGGEMAEGFPVVLCGLLVVVIGLLVGIGILGAESRVGRVRVILASWRCVSRARWRWGRVEWRVHMAFACTRPIWQPCLDRVLS